jgi:hypothetical protein
MDEREELLAIQTQESKLEQSIQDGKNQTDEITHKISFQSAEITRKINSEQDEVKRHISETANLTINSANAIRKFFTPKLNAIIDSLEFYLLIVAVLFISAGVLGVILLSYLFSDTILGFIIFWIPITIFTLNRLNEQNKKIKLYSSAIDNEVTNLTNQLTAKNTSVKFYRTDLSLFDRLVSTLNNAGTEVASAALDMLPLTGKYLDHHNKRLQRDRFLLEFRNAMLRYGFPVNGAPFNSKLRTKLWLSENEDKFLADSISIMTKIYPDADPLIFKLFYFEFTNNNELEQLWKIFKNSEVLRIQLARALIYNKVVLEGKLNENSVPALGKLLGNMLTFSLTEVNLRSSEFFNKLSEFKLNSLDIVNNFGFKVVTLKDTFLDFVPNSDRIDQWQEGVLSYLANDILHEDQDVIKLIVKDGLGDSDKLVSWKEIVRAEKLVKLAKVLTKSRIHKQYLDIDDDALVSHTILCLSCFIEKDFIIPDIAAKVVDVENTIMRTKRLTVNCAKFYRMDAKELDEVIHSFNPTDVSKVEMEFVEKSASIYNVDVELFKFLYKTQNNLKIDEEEYKSFIGHNGSILSNFLVSKAFVPGGDFSNYIELLLKEQSSFELSKFMQLATKYERLFSSVKSLENFLELHKLSNGSSFNFKKILDICPIDSQISFENELVTICSQMLKVTYESLSLDANHIKQVSTASVLLFLKQQNDPLFRVMCKELYFMKFGNRVLYLHLYQSEAKIGAKMLELSEAVIQAGKIDIDDIKYTYLEFFKVLLLDGKLPENASSMIEVRIDSLRNDLKIAQENGLEKNLFQNYVKPISDLLNHKINEDIVKDFLTTKALSAFIVTVPKNYKGIGFISNENKKAIKLSAKKLAERTNDDSFLTLFQLEKGTGKSTRIGLVPFGMRFEEFSTKFETLMNEAVILANTKGANYPYPLPYYLVRIFPSEDALKEIMRRNDVKTSPFEIIREMIKERVGFDESIPILSLLQKTGASDHAVKQVIESIIDHPESNLYTFSEDIICNLFKQYPNTLNYFRSGKVDKQLFKIYGVTKLSLLCITLTDQLYSNGSSVVCQILKQHLIDSIPYLNQQLTNENVEFLTNDLLRRMKGVGTTLRLQV